MSIYPNFFKSQGATGTTRPTKAHRLPLRSCSQHLASYTPIRTC